MALKRTVVISVQIVVSMIDCIVEWYCLRLKKNVKVDTNAMPEIDPIGNPMWICDCKVKRRQQWTSGNDPFHKPVCYGFRNNPY